MKEWTDAAARPGTGWSPARRAASALALGGILAMLGACAEGYPGASDPMVLNHDTSADEAVSAMNQISRRLGERVQWSADARACELVMERRRGFGERVQLDLRHHEARLGRSDDPELHDVILVPKEPAAPSGRTVVVVTDARWSDAVMVRWIVQHLRRHCEEATA